MIHLDPIGDFAPHHPCETQELERHRGKLLRVERLRSKVKAAKAAAAESLSRANDAPEPHDSANTLFVALFDAHCRDREKLFEAMRELDEACRELHAASAGTNFVASLPHRPAKQLEGTAFHR